MPGKKAKKSKMKRKAGRASWRSGAQNDVFNNAVLSTMSGKNNTGVPHSKRVTLRYTDVYGFTLTAGTTGAQIMRGNSVFDPDQTSTGHQPYYFDQWAAMYLYYNVLGSRIHLTAAATNTIGATEDMITAAVGFYPATSTTAFALPQGEEHPDGRSAIVNGFGTPPIMSRYLSTTKFLGLPKSAAFRNDLSTVVTSNPATQWYWIVYIAPLRTGTDQKYSLQVSVEYDVMFFGRLEETSSLERKIAFSRTRLDVLNKRAVPVAATTRGSDYKDKPAGWEEVEQEDEKEDSSFSGTVARPAVMRSAVQTPIGVPGKVGVPESAVLINGRDLSRSGTLKANLK